MFAKRFQEDCEDKYNRKKIKYGESWKTMSIKELQLRLMDEFDEWKINKDKSPTIVYGELIDVRNIASMLAERTIEHLPRVTDFKGAHANKIYDLNLKEKYVIFNDNKNKKIPISYGNIILDTRNKTLEFHYKLKE